jgi:hypothetical protein
MLCSGRQEVEINITLADDALRDVRQLFLQVGLCRADHQQVGTVSFELRRHLDLSRDARERFILRLVAVRQRKRRRTREMRVVVGAAGCDAHHPDVERRQQIHGFYRFGKIDLQPPAVAAEGKT